MKWPRILFGVKCVLRSAASHCSSNASVPPLTPTSSRRTPRSALTILLTSSNRNARVPTGVAFSSAMAFGRAATLTASPPGGGGGQLPDICSGCQAAGARRGAGSAGRSPASSGGGRLAGVRAQVEGFLRAKRVPVRRRTGIFSSGLNSHPLRGFRVLEEYGGLQDTLEQNIALKKLALKRVNKTVIERFST